jgi:hypothetical protein
VRVAAILSLLASARASAVVLTSSWPIIGGSIPVTLTLTDVAAVTQSRSRFPFRRAKETSSVSSGTS